ncbi:N5-glutamine methyltransferase family protein [Blastococcus brunescens]|uniref:Methyltransferase n=1 Tax=Blastococcus brunescens TaxID=1564165 RepID=A0ABZ1BAT2_9ACTN|nr:methyltransferase [Blastococcus sp. BMG 8361]WRL67113.1 methyltransferase [Blastococcus sp. BMG 8361]
MAGWAVERLTGLDGPIVVDLGSGSGAIGLSIAHEHPGARVTAVERDPGAIAWTRHNAMARVAAGDTPVGVVQGDMTDPALLSELDGRAAVVVSNPPYVPDDAVLPREVADHDPPLALWGGPDGLDVVRGMLAVAVRLLQPGDGSASSTPTSRASRCRPSSVRTAGSPTSRTTPTWPADRASPPPGGREPHQRQHPAGRVLHRSASVTTTTSVRQPTSTTVSATSPRGPPTSATAAASRRGRTVRAVPAPAASGTRQGR